MTKDDQEKISEKNKALVNQIYAGALDPAAYMDIVHAWDAHFEELGRLGDGPHTTDFEWTDEFVEHFERAGAFFDKIIASDQPPLRARVEAMPNAAIVVDLRETIVLANAAAGAIFEGSVPDTLSELELDAKSIRAVQDLFASAHAPDLPGDRIVIRLYRNTTDAPHIILADLVHDRLDSDSAPQPWLLMRMANAAWQDGVGRALQAAFDLSQAELALVEHLYRGLTVKEIAQWKGRSTATLRTQLSSVLNKTGVKTQIGLTRIVSGLVHVLERDRAGDRLSRASASAQRRALKTRYRVAVTDNVQMDVVEIGDPAGVPVYVIQTTIWPGLSPNVEEALAQQGIRLIAAHRPGVGETTRLPVTTTPAEWAVLHEKLLEHLGLAHIVIGGQCSGGVYALALARQLGPHCRGVFLSDVGAPLKNAKMINQMPPGPRRLFLGARYFPLALKTPYKLAHSDFYSGPDGEARGVRYFVEDSPADQAAVKSPDIWQIVRDNFDYCIQNPAQAARDVRYWSQDVTPALDAALAICPVHYFHGAQNLMHLPGNIAALAETRPGITFDIVQGHGQLALYQQPEVFARSLSAFAHRCHAQTSPWVQGPSFPMKIPRSL